MRTDSTMPPPTSLSDAASGGRTVAARNSAVIDRTDAMLRMASLGMTLDEIEQQLDWLDAQTRLKQQAKSL